MIPSLDTYVYTKVKENLNAILQQPLIIQEALNMLDKEARENFIKTYCGVNPKKEIGVSYVFPQVKETFDARIVIQLGDGQEEANSLGSVEGTFNYRDTGDHEEETEVKYDGERLYIETLHTIGDFASTDRLSFAARDNMKVEGNRVYFNKQGNESLIGMELTIYYTSKESLEKDPKGIHKGYTSRDVVEVTPVSTNIDTARCLDALMKVILIIMLEDMEEKTTYGLQSANFSAMQNLIGDGDRIIFGRPLTLSYTVSYSIDFDFTREIKEIILKGVTPLGRKEK